MSAYYFGARAHQPSGNPSHNHHGGRSRRAPRVSSSQNSHRQFRGVRSMKELTEAPINSAFRVKFEAMRSFDLDDDLEFCPGLLTEDDVSTARPASAIADCMGPLGADAVSLVQLQSIHSSSSDRSSLASGSPSSSPLQHQAIPTTQVSPPFSLATTYQSASSFQPPPSQPSQGQPGNQLKIHQPSALRTRNAIPIVNPSTGMQMASPPQSVSPARMQQQTYQRRW
jgi:hypothetical protein